MAEASFKTPFGWLNVTYNEQHVYRAEFGVSVQHVFTSTPLHQLIQSELDAYFSDPYHRFQLPLKPEGTAYQRRVWNELLVIPAGRALTYGELARVLQSAPRAVGQACKRNPLALFIPCHRVIGKDNYGGYMGLSAALDYKLHLLKHENFIK